MDHPKDRFLFGLGLRFLQGMKTQPTKKKKKILTHKKHGSRGYYWSKNIDFAKIRFVVNEEKKTSCLL